MAIVEYAKYGNLRDYLRNKRIHSYFVFNLQRNITVKNQISNLLTLLSSSASSHDKEDESIDFRDLVNFSFQIALGMDYLHTKKVNIYKFLFLSILLSIQVNYFSSKADS